MYMGSIFGFGNIFLPLVSWNILPLPIAVFLSESIGKLFLVERVIENTLTAYTFIIKWSRF